MTLEIIEKQDLGLYLTDDMDQINKAVIDGVEVTVYNSSEGKRLAVIDGVGSQVILLR